MSRRMSPIFPASFRAAFRPRHFGVTSLCDRGINLSLSDVDLALLKTFERTFGATVRTHSAAFDLARLARCCSTAAL
jgi:hypothetical protein